MVRRRTAKPRKERRKAVKVQYVPRPDKKRKPPDPDPYRFLDAMVGDTHDDLAGAKIAIAWMHDVKPDRDGHLVLGKAKKATDLDREFREFDLVILLNAAAWKSLSEEQRFALMDHELCHCTVALDKNDNPILDERERKCYRMRKHEIEEFHGVVKRHGLYTHTLQELVRVATETPLFPAGTEAEKK